MNRTVALAALALGLALTAKPAAAQEKASGGNEGALVVDKKLADAGKKLFTAKTCNACHTIGKGPLAAPDLDGVFDRRSQEWIRKWLHDPKAMLATDDYAKALKEKYHIEMPNLGLTDDDITALMNYIASQSKAGKK